MGQTQESGITHQNGWSPKLQYHGIEEVGGWALGLQKGGRQFT